MEKTLDLVVDFVVDKDFDGEYLIDIMIWQVTGFYGQEHRLVLPKSPYKTGHFP